MQKYASIAQISDEVFSPIRFKNLYTESSITRDL